jgi:hypothetical protein
MFTSTGFSFVGIGKRSTRVDSEPQIAQKLKAIREKKERFFESRKVAGCARILARVLRVKAATGG